MRGYPIDAEIIYIQFEMRYDVPIKKTNKTGRRKT
jgi:hypothetical protein